MTNGDKKRLFFFQKRHKKTGSLCEEPVCVCACIVLCGGDYFTVESSFLILEVLLIPALFHFLKTSLSVY